MRLHESPDTYLELIQATADRIGIPAVHVEKDYWVTRVLKRLHESDHRAAVVFKGGTSLAKAHRLVERFSEDVDLALRRDDGLSDSRRRALIRSIEEEITQDLRYQPEHLQESKHGRFRKTAHAFSMRTSAAELGQVSEILLIEINSFANPTPSSDLPIATLIHDFLVDAGRADLVRQYQLDPFSIYVLGVERALCEKVMAFGARRSFGHPGIDDIDAHALEIPDVARRHGHAAGVGDRRDLAVRRLSRPSGGTAHGRDVRVGARRGAVEGEDTVVERTAKKPFDVGDQGFRLRPAARMAAPYRNSASPTAEKKRSSRSWAATQSPTAGSGDRAINSDTTLVSTSTDIAARSIEGRRFAHWAARRQFQVHPVVRAEVRAGNLREVPRTPAALDRVAQDDARLFLHRTVMLGGAHAKARLHVVVKISDRDAGHRSCLLMVRAKAIGCSRCKQANVIRRFAAPSRLLRGVSVHS